MLSKPMVQPNDLTNALRQTKAGEHPSVLWAEMVRVAQGMTKQLGKNILMQDPKMLLPHEQAKRIFEILSAPVKTTAGLLQDFGKDVMGQPGGYWDKTRVRVEKYRPITASLANAAEGAVKGPQVAATGAMAGQAYNAWESAGSPMGMTSKDVTKHSKPESHAEKVAAYRYEQGKKYGVNEQWDSFKEGVIKDLRRQGLDEDTVGKIRSLPRGSVGQDDFADHLYKSVKVPKTSKAILNAWQEEVSEAGFQYQSLSRKGDFVRVEGKPSALAEMEKNVFSSSRAADPNKAVAEMLREQSKMYTDPKDSFRAKAYERAADIVSQKGAPNLIGLMEKGGATAIMDAFKGQGGIGSGISGRIEEFLSSGEMSVTATIQDMAQVAGFPKAQGRK